MGYWHPDGNKQITNFTPDDTDTMVYIPDYEQRSLESLLERAKEKWGDDIDPSRISIGAEYIHTRCLTYDLFDPSDWENYITLTLEN